MLNDDAKKEKFAHGLGGKIFVGNFLHKTPLVQSGFDNSTQKCRIFESSGLIAGENKARGYWGPPSARYKDEIPGFVPGVTHE